MAPSLRVSAIIPTFNEAILLEGCLRSLILQSSLAEVVGVDGGSIDATEEVMRRFQPLFEGAGIAFRQILAWRGRAVQMNAGAAAAEGHILLFLHADTLLPPGAVAAVVEAIRQRHVGGAFRHQFLERDSRLAAISLYANTRSRWSRVFFGDQAIFVRRDIFRELGGFRPIPIMEDLEFSSRMRRKGPTTLLPERVLTSGRRFLSGGIGRTCARMLLLRTAYRIGVDPKRLERHYGEVR